MSCEGREGGACIQALAFDSAGELLVAGSDEGMLSVHSSASLLDAARCSGGGPAAAAVPAAADPLLLLYCGVPRLHALRWNAADENCIAVSSAATRALQLYDLEHTQVGGRATPALRTREGTCLPYSMGCLVLSRLVVAMLSRLHCRTACSHAA